MRHFLVVLALIAVVTVGLAGVCIDDSDDDDDTDEGYEFNSDDLSWEWVPIDGAICRDGSRTGIGIRENVGSRKLAIFLDGGGACATLSTCLESPRNFPEERFNQWVAGDSLSMALFSAEVEENPLREYSFVYIPYCTGDLHMGSKPNGVVPLLIQRQQFVGWNNSQLFMDAIEERFAGEVDQVVLLGMSAGGFGVLAAFPLVAEAFPSADLVMLNDSAPIFFDDSVLTPCYQTVIRWMWNVNEALPEDCSACFQEGGDGLAAIQTHLSKTYPHARFGLFSSMADISIRSTYGPGQNNCKAGSDARVKPWQFRAALVDLRDNYLLPEGNWTTFFIEGINHGTLFYERDPAELLSTNYFDAQYNGVYFTDRLGQLLEGLPRPVGPSK
ncbi:MAG: pectin acetylesterase-family hydrolase [Candidatus Lernaella stagnicola]|nr:pectin acetylesterase-family hydrolase [Candidatus Lernaella stagnicola]